MLIRHTSAGLDKASLGRILTEPDIVACIPSHYGKAMGNPLSAARDRETTML